MTAGGSSGNLKLKQGAVESLGADVSGLELDVVNISPTIVRVTIGAKDRWVVPQSDLFNSPKISGATVLLSVPPLLDICYDLTSEQHLACHLNCILLHMHRM